MVKLRLKFFYGNKCTYMTWTAVIVVKIVDFSMQMKEKSQRLGLYLGGTVEQ